MVNRNAWNIPEKKLLFMKEDRERNVPLIQRYKHGTIVPVTDCIAVEEPLEIFLDGEPYYMTMRLPGDEIPLALGYCFGEGIIDASDDVLLINYCGEENGNRLDITLGRRYQGERRSAINNRRLPAYSGCGLCGKALISDVCTSFPERSCTFSLPVSRIDGLIDTVQKHQQSFKNTGATHAAAAFGEDLKLLAFSEDIGRHNALDKVTGKLLLSGCLNAVAIIVITSRISFEVVQKTARTGAQILIGFSSATSLAVQLADEARLTLVGFARGGQGNIYTMPERLL